MRELKIDEDLCRAALYHSFDMGAQNYFEHATYDRDESTNRLQEVCGTFARKYQFGDSYGENIVAGNATGNGTYTSGSTVHDISEICSIQNLKLLTQDILKQREIITLITVLLTLGIKFFLF